MMMINYYYLVGGGADEYFIQMVALSWNKTWDIWSHLLGASSLLTFSSDLIIATFCFSDLRLQLLDTQHNYFLLKSLYGLLMLLPQSDAFTTLKNRLDCVPNGRVLSSDTRYKVSLKTFEFLNLIRNAY